MRGGLRAALFDVYGIRGKKSVCCTNQCAGQRWVREKIYDPALNGREPSYTITTLIPSPGRKEAAGKNIKWKRKLPVPHPRCLQGTPHSGKKKQLPVLI
jgi:hypothetical protein